MKEKVHIKHNKSFDAGFAHSSVMSASFNFTGNTYNVAQPSLLPFYSTDRPLVPLKVGPFEVIPFGENNQYPQEIKSLLDDYGLVDELMKKKISLLFGQGPALYEERFENGRKIKYFDTNTEIQRFLDDINYRFYLNEVLTDYTIAQGYYTKFYRNKGVRIGNRGFIADLKLIPNYISRLEWYDSNYVVHNIITGDFYQPWKNGLTRFPVWNEKNPFNNPVSMRYSNLVNYGLNYQYSKSTFHGSITWIKLAASIAQLLFSFNENSAAIKYHIEVPAIFWEAKRLDLVKKSMEKGIDFSEKMLDDLKKEYLDKIIAVLTNYENVGKLVMTDISWHEDAREFVGWKINVLDQKIKDFIDAQVNISKRAAFEVSAGVGLHPALSNITHEGNLPSGSEQLYAFKLFVMTGTDIPEMIVTRDINDAIKVNFPGTKYRLGFYHDNVMTEEQTSPKDRIKNN
jgi:hypothetical protein